MRKLYFRQYPKYRSGKNTEMAVFFNYGNY